MKTVVLEGINSLNESLGGRVVSTKVVGRYLDCDVVLKDYLEDYENRKDTVKLNISKILWLGYFKKRQLLFPVTWLRTIGIDNKSFNRLYNKYDLLECIDETYDKEFKIAKIYQYTENAKQIVRMCRKHKLPSRTIIHVEVEDIVSGNTKIVIVDCKDTEENIVKTDDPVDYRHPVYINFEKLDEYIDVQNNGTLADKANRIYVKYSSIDHEYYRRHNCGRLFTVGGVTLQNVEKEIRNQSLYGCWVYDIQNCHYTICSHITNHYAIKEYAEDPSMVRNTISQRTGIPVNIVKKALLALAYGATANKSIREIVGAENVANFMNEDLVNNLREGLSKVKADIAKEGSMEGMTIHQRFSEYIMQIEGEILDVIIAHVGSEDNVVCCSLFDGLVVKKRLSPKVVESAVRMATGYTVTITEEKIEGETT